MLFAAIGLFLCTILTACTAPRSEEPVSTQTEIPQAGLPNLASVYCEENGNKVDRIEVEG